MKILHIGFGKTATTSLQGIVFPRLCRDLGISFVTARDSRIKKHRATLELGKEPDLNHVFYNTLVSNEALCSWDPFFWEDWAKKNATFFGCDSHVLLVIREPESYLKSIYLQQCFHQGNVASPKEFFLDRKRYSPYLSCAKFSIEDFSYVSIINIYKKYFQSVTVVKYEDMSSLLSLKELFCSQGFCYDQWEELSQDFMRSRSNPSYGHLAVILTLRMQRFLSFFGFSLRPSEISTSYQNLDSLSNKSINESKAVKTGLVKKALRGVMNFFVWRKLMRNFISKISRRKFLLDFSTIDGLDISFLKHEYEGIASVTHYYNGVKIQ